MSEQKTYIAGYFPDEKSESDGIRKVATSLEAKDLKHAKAKAAFLFIEEYPAAQDAAYKTLVCEDTPEVPSRPVIGSWDQEFLYNYDWPEDIGHPVKREAPKVDFDKLSPTAKIAVLVKYDTTEITKADLPAALELTQDEANTFEGHTVEAISKMPEIANMHPERIQHAIGWILAKCDHSSKWPEIQKELTNWKKRQDGESRQGGSSKSIVDIAREKAAAEKIKNAPVNIQDQDSLKRNIALGLVAKAMDFDVLNPPGSIVNRARDIIKLKEKPFPAWLDAMSKTIGIYEYSGVQIIYSVKISPDGLDSTVGAIQTHINRTFTETDHQNPSAEMIAIASGEKFYQEGESSETKQEQKTSTVTLDNTTSTTGTVANEMPGDAANEGTLENASHVERTGPFYWRDAEGNTGRANKLEKLQELIAAGYEEISKEEHLALKNGTKPDSQHDVVASDEVGKLLAAQRGDYVEGISDPDDPKWVKDSTEPNPFQQVTVDHDTSFIVRADELEKELGDSENLRLWRGVMRTNPRYTKDMSDLGFGGTSINAEYMIMRATEMFGPVGKGWGWHVVEDKMLEGGPLTEKIFEGNKFIGKRTLRDADGSLINELNHFLKIELWYLTDGERAVVESYGSTVYRQTTKNGIYCDSEVHKKSLTDAIKKALSTLGFSADVWLGLYDDAAYRAESAIEFGIKDATDKAEDSTRIREELDERFKSNVETMRKAVTQNEVSKIASSLTRTISVHLKTAKETADNDYVKYLEGRLRRLEEVKLECLKSLEENA